MVIIRLATISRLIVKRLNIDILSPIYVHACMPKCLRICNAVPMNDLPNRRYTRYFGSNGLAAPRLVSYALNSYKTWEQNIDDWQNPILRCRLVAVALINACTSSQTKRMTSLEPSLNKWTPIGNRCIPLVNILQLGQYWESQSFRKPRNVCAGKEISGHFVNQS